MEEKITTIEELAAMINRSFNAVATKEDLKLLATKEDLKAFATKEEMNKRFDEVDTRLDHLDARVGRIEQDIHEVREEAVDPLKFEDALGRISYVERKLGIESGV